MHSKHTFTEDPAYFWVEKGKRYAVYLCDKNKEQHCWKDKRELVNTVEKRASNMGGKFSTNWSPDVWPSINRKTL